MNELLLHPIGVLHTPHASRESVPKGLGARHRAEGTLELRAELADGLKDIEGFSHLYVIWIFDRSEGWELVGRNPTDGLSHGVFATRSPRRPNPIGLTVVELIGREGNVLRLRGVDMLDGSPVLDIKPYLSNVDPAQLRRGWLDDAEAHRPDREAPPL